MGHQPDLSSPAGGLVASVLGADEHDHLSSSVVITHQGQRPTAPLTHSLPSQSITYMFQTLSFMLSVSHRISATAKFQKGILKCVAFSAFTATLSSS